MILETPRTRETERTSIASTCGHSGVWLVESPPPLVDHASRGRYIEIGR